ncbi:GNAT family N-acetyltransferase [Arthrobacter gandavensis]|nr:GNAT family N-acetyltransferase [Arthrobacter gandavensis]
MPLPPWPAGAPGFGRVLLRPVNSSDAGMAMALATDPYVCATGTLPLNAGEQEALAWVRRQQGRHREGRGFSFTIEERASSLPVGHCGLWVQHLAHGHASAGYAIAPGFRGRGLAADALAALTAFGWSLPGLRRIELFIEPWNAASVRTAECAGYAPEGLRRDYPLAGGERRDMRVFAVLRPDKVAAD